MNIKTWLKAYAAAWLVLAALDALWLGWLARDFYREQMGELMSDQVRLLPAVLFYLGYPAALVSLGLMPRPASMRTAVLRSAGLGVMAYATYDLTNWATLAVWSGTLAAVDVTWGAVISGAAGLAAWWVSRPRA